MNEEERKRLDKTVEDAGIHLASRYTRRGFLGRVAAATGAVLWGGAMILGESREAEAAAAAAGCFGTVDVNVCFTAWKVIAAQSGYSGVVMRKGPSMSAPAIYDASGNVVVIPVNGHFGRVSNRNGGVASGCPDPGPRASVNGFLWGYAVSGGKQGWIPYQVGGVTYSTPAPNDRYCCGPAQEDFDCKDSGLSDAAKRVHCPDYNGCGGDTAGSVTLSGAFYRIADRGSNALNSEERFYIRYAKNSTTFGWLLPGDIVKRLSYSSGTDPTWSCIYCYCTAWQPYGCRGWVRSDALGSSGSFSSCSGSGDCPSGSLYP